MGELEGAELGGAAGEEEVLVWGFTYGGLWTSLVMQSPPWQAVGRTSGYHQGIFAEQAL